jgi:DNA (cytosine-5)-methyltransferase 1
LTPRECARLQSFPEEYILHSDDNKAYRQLGNAVNVKMIEKCTRFLILGESLFE